jgi:hypothetical protein
MHMNLFVGVRVGEGGAYIMLSPWNLSQTTGQLAKLHRHR